MPNAYEQFTSSSTSASRMLSSGGWGVEAFSGWKKKKQIWEWELMVTQVTGNKNNSSVTWIFHVRTRPREAESMDTRAFPPWISNYLLTGLFSRWMVFYIQSASLLGLFLVLPSWQNCYWHQNPIDVFCFPNRYSEKQHFSSWTKTSRSHPSFYRLNRNDCRRSHDWLRRTWEENSGDPDSQPALQTPSSVTSQFGFPLGGLGTLCRG